MKNLTLISHDKVISLLNDQNSNLKTLDIKSTLYFFFANIFKKVLQSYIPLLKCQRSCL